MNGIDGYRSDEAPRVPIPIEKCYPSSEYLCNLHNMGCDTFSKNARARDDALPIRREVILYGFHEWVYDVPHRRVLHSSCLKFPEAIID